MSLLFLQIHPALVGDRLFQASALQGYKTSLIINSQILETFNHLYEPREPTGVYYSQNLKLYAHIVDIVFRHFKLLAKAIY